MRVLRGALAVVCAGVAVLAAACGSGDGRKISGDLHVFNWDDYFAPSTLADFEEEFGVEVYLDTFEDEAELLSVVSSDPSSYDVFIGSDALIGEMKELRLLAKLDHGNIPNLANIDPKFLNLPGDPDNEYSVPYDWGTTGVMYNKKCIEPEEESWSLLRDPRVAGKVAMDSDPSVVIGSTLQSLGYPLNSGDRQQLAEAVEVLRQQVSTLGLRFISSEDLTEMMRSEELCAAQAYNGDAVVVMSENEDVAFFIPREGSDIYFDMMAVPRDAPNKVAAEAFINYILRPEVQAACNEYTGYATPSHAAIEEGYVGSEMLSDPVIYPDVTRLESWIAFDGPRRALWNEAWASVQREAASSQDQ
jgi:spermidine/putrescine transport system substrate-binding protein